jgi:hypothetical protein
MDKKIKLFKYFVLGLITYSIFTSFGKNCASFALDFQDVEFAFDEDEPDKEVTESKDLVKKSFSKGPNKADFFVNKINEKNILLGTLNNLSGKWVGQYSLANNSISWIGKEFSSDSVGRIENFGKNDFIINFNFDEIGSKNKFSIIKHEQEFGQVNFQIVKDKQLNYWSKSVNNELVQVLRGKLIRKNENELVTVFQITAYQNNAPIYAFISQVLLKRTSQ